MQVNFLELKSTKKKSPTSKEKFISVNSNNPASTLQKPSFENLLAYSKITFKSKMEEHLGQGARYQGNDTTKFLISAPFAEKISVQIVKDDDYKNPKTYPLEKIGDKFESTIKNVAVGDKYRFKVTSPNGETFTTYDPRADFLPNDIDGYKKNSDWSQIIDHSTFNWTDEEWIESRKDSNTDSFGWGIPNDTVIESIHIGALGGFTKAKEELDRIAHEKVATAVRVMPIGEFYGSANWGYDESAKFAVENAYGDPNDFKSFVNYAHAKGIKVFLDVVPNHFGPNGTNIHRLMPTFAEGKDYAWGKMLEFNGENGKYMRSYMTDMLMNWAVNYHVDGFRFDATHVMDSDDTVKGMISELRSHHDTRKLILYPEDMRISRTLANSNMAKKVKEFNWGFNGLTTFDFYKSLLANATPTEVHDFNPNLSELEYIYKNGIKNSHEEKALEDYNCPEWFKDHSRYILEHVPKNGSDNFIVNISNHDEIGNDAGGKRNMVSILSDRLGMVLRCDMDWKQASWLTFDMIKNYAKFGCCLPEEIQRKYGCNNPVTKEEFDGAIHDAFETNKMIIGAMFMHPSPKEFFVGDERGELAPFKFFCEMPPTSINPHNKKTYEQELEEQKGYPANKIALRESRINNPDYSIDWIKKGTLKFSKDFAAMLKEIPVFQTADFNHICTYAHNDKNILEVKRYNDFDEEVIALINFSDNAVDGFEAKTTRLLEVSEIINSNDTKYNGNGKYNNKWKEHIYTNDLTIPPHGIIVIEP